MQLSTKKLQVWHYPQVPCKPFIVDVKDEFEAKKIVYTLASQHLWLYTNRIIPDYSNSIQVMMFDEDSDGEGTPDWINYYNDTEDMEWDEFVETYISNS
jgi:hypothetical protein